MHKILPPQTAFKAKLLGFNRPVQNRYIRNGLLNKNGNIRYGEPINYNDPCFQDEGRKYISAPTNAELLSYLLEEFGISVEVYFYQDKWEFDVWNTIENMDFFHPTSDAMKFDDYGICLDRAFNLVLNKLLWQRKNNKV